MNSTEWAKRFHKLGSTVGGLMNTVRHLRKDVTRVELLEKDNNVAIAEINEVLRTLEARLTDLEKREGSSNG